MTEKTTSTVTRLLNFFSRRPIRFARFFAKILSRVVNLFHLSKSPKSIRLNLEICLPHLSHEHKELLVRAAISNELQSYMEFFSIWGSSNAENIARIRNITGEHYFHEAMAEKKGIVLLAPHFGTWEVMNAWFAQHTKMTIMYKPIKNDEADQFVRQARSRERAHLVPTDESGVRQIFKALKMGGTTVVLPDHTPKHSVETIDYFGLPLASSNLSSKLIQKTKAKALLVYAIRNDTEDFDMFIEPIDEKIYEGTPNEGTLVIHHAIENLIRKYPEHAHWSYKRFKANPELREIYNLPFDEAVAVVNRVRAENSTASNEPPLRFTK
ncbi:lysophospholipid acyltransferase family protein [Acinetobacter shaoyimingii]|uniref:Lipid A biosynthesis acyltransferase n=1 Tax=Acinetobacter shaoyimingii TaxID=2715164 RepID=A0A6G8RUH3_9GAMM|nr:lipid A biosynthesis acyltransferase [Acinetobacter shaoyimingii]NHB58466.1 lipid A biosynthesis acyltransferase [Acinetobacter shaoyimingii]QIO05438.1 lipid A biosynthesis acyltransferase [Acinetobacter shaoyimingii]